MERSETMPLSEKQELIDRLIIPFDEIAKHLTANIPVEEAKYEEEIDRTDSAKVRYEETALTNQNDEEIKSSLAVDDSKVRVKAERLMATDDSNMCKGCEMLTTRMESTTSLTVPTVAATTTTESTTTMAIASSTTEATPLKSAHSTDFKDIDTIEGFQKFADSLIAMD